MCGDAVPVDDGREPACIKGRYTALEVYFTDRAACNMAPANSKALQW